MLRSDFSFDLPDELIARYPKAQRTDSRLLVLTGRDGHIAHHKFTDLLDFLTPDDLLVFNNTRVIPARIWAQKATGGQVEILLERIITPTCVLAHVRASKSPIAGSELWLKSSQHKMPNTEVSVTVLGRQDNLFELDFKQPVMGVLEQFGHMPLPPYMEREDELSDQQRYQTVYAQRDGAVAAPTAGLHFSQDFIQSIRDKGVNTAYVTLHVGAGTFQPVRVDDVRDHVMHSEYLEVDKQVCEQVNICRANGGRVIAVGTTAVRSLETASRQGEISPYSGDSDIFIYPGYQFNSVDALITNFHLPESTLIMLVSAFAGREQVLNAYSEAIKKQYQFYSYGDAMLVFPF